MKKLLITISPFYVALFILMWIVWGIKAALTFFGFLPFIIVISVLAVKWAEFVYKHFDD